MTFVFPGILLQVLGDLSQCVQTHQVHLWVKRNETVSGAVSNSRRSHTDHRQKANHSPRLFYPFVCRSRTPVFSRSFSLWAACCSNRCACFSAAPASCCPFRRGTSAGEVKKVNFLIWFYKTSKRLTYPQKRKQTFVSFFSSKDTAPAICLLKVETLFFRLPRKSG